MVQRFFFNGVYAKASGKAIGNQFQVSSAIGAYKAESSFALLDFA
jgi:hypothetical protein